MLDMVVNFLTSHLYMFSVCTGEVYLTQFMEKVWVRAEVEEIDTATASVLYIDFGYREKVSREK